LTAAVDESPKSGIQSLGFNLNQREQTYNIGVTPFSPKDGMESRQT